LVAGVFFFGNIFTICQVGFTMSTRYHGTIGDLNPIEHGGGVVSSNKYGFWLHYFDPVEDEVYVYLVPIPEPHEFLLTFDWVDWKAVANACGCEPEELRGHATSKNPLARAHMIETITFHYGWVEFDDSPAVLSLEEAEQQWGPLVDRVLGGNFVDPSEV
jgi:hypothetical protein